MKILNIIFYAVWLLIVALLQPTVIRWIEIFGIGPNIFLIFVIAAALICGKKAGAVCGLVFGLTLDMLVGRMIGVNALIFLYAGFFVGILCERFISGSGTLVAAVITLSASVLCG
ncbi:MAG: rod shape-determining protein MreD, partial [Clostridia bacterium]|nr:rod shape-determining protein MreD [Clostridia bacterium]